MKNYLKVLPKYDTFLKTFESKTLEEVMPKVKFTGKLLESRKKVKEERKERVTVDIKDILEGLLLHD